MKRRDFLLGLLAFGVDVAATQPARTYSFLWAPPEPRVEPFTLADLQRAEEELRRHNVQPDADGHYYLAVDGQRIWYETVSWEVEP